MRKWTRISRKVIFRSPFCSFEHDRFRLPNGTEGDYYHVNSPGAVMVIPVDNDGKVVLVRQYRYLIDEDSLEFPAGGIHQGMDPLEQAKKELEEEAGVTAGNWEPAGRFASWNGVTNEICRLFIARDLRKVKSTCDPTEEFEVVRHTWSEILEMAERNEIFDGMTLASIALARGRLDRYGSE